MRSCILVFYLTATILPAAHDFSRAIPQDDPDVLYRDRAVIAHAERAVDLWAARLARDPSDVDAAVKLGRACYWLGGHAPDAQRRAWLDRGMEAARRAIALKPDRPDGHFWLAACMGALAESFGLRAGIRYRKPIKEALERVIALDRSFQQGSADRALGRWYFKVPGLFGGGNRKSEEHLRRALEYNPRSAITRYFLAETLIDMNRAREAREELRKVIDGPIDPEWAPEDREFKAKAERLIERLRD